MTQCVILCDVSGHTYGRRVKQRRTELDMAVRRAAELSGVSVTRWADIERGGELRGGGVRANRKRPYRKTVLKMAGALGWPPDDALRWAGYNEPLTVAPTTSTGGINTLSRLQQMWPALSGRQQAALTELVEAFLTSERLDPDTHLRELVIDAPVDPMAQPADDDGDPGQISPQP